jgi:protein-S-isoprenylcysteine O-methyltransferase Ste14
MRKILIPPVFVLLSLILIIAFYFKLPAYNWIPFPINLLGIIVSISGFILMSKARMLFKKHKTTFTYKTSSQMVTDGIFSKSRNPMYIGMFLFILGIGICFRNVFSSISAFGFLAAIQFISIPFEEKMMEDTFGQEYVDYKKSVRRWI